MGVTPVEFRGDLWRQKTRLPVWAIVWCCLCDPTFSRFNRTPTCDGQTDGRTDGHRAMASTADAYIASRGSGVAGHLAARGGGQICRPFVLGFGNWRACFKV